MVLTPTPGSGFFIDKGMPLEYSNAVNTVAETTQFQKKAKRLLSNIEKESLIVHLAANPRGGVVIEGTGGIRKLRWGRADKGKSGGVRVIYYYHSEIMPLYLLTVFGKNERANISQREKQMLAKMVDQLVDYWRRRNG